MMEGWFLIGYQLFLILSSIQILPLTQNALFQHSNWGEAPNLYPDYLVNPVYFFVF